MAEYQYIAPTGIIVPDTSELQDDVISEWREAFGDDLVVTPETPQGVLIAAEVESRDNVVRNNAAVANQINPNLAGGVFLDAIWALTRGKRRSAVRSIINGVVLGGQPGTIIPAGSLATVESTGEQFRTVSTVIIESGGTVAASMQAVEFGPIAAPIGSLTSVATSILGWETVTNPNAAALGREQESDIQARRRRRNTLALQGVSLPEAVTSHVYDVDGVQSLAFRENVTDTAATIDGILIDPHSIYVCVDGGTDADVAFALLESKSFGAGWTGDTDVSIVEPFSGQTYTVSFQRPDEIDVFARITAKYNGTDGATIIREAVLSYAAGELDGDAGFVVGADVYPFELSGAVNQVSPVIVVTNVELSTDGITYAAAPIPVGLDEVARITSGSISVIPA